MKFRKMIVLAVAMGAAFSLPVQAQDAGKKGGGRGQMTPEARIQRIEEAVGSLTADQKSKITAIYNKLQSDMQAIPQEERREKMMPLMQAAQKDVRAVLTAEQQKKFDEMPQGRGPGGPGGGKKKGN
jgi:Spy/CpxP family protein refolding chaperone